MESLRNKSGSLRRNENVHRCLSCGTTNNLGRKSYCSQTCRQELCRGLDILTSLLRALTTRYATFSFDREYLTLDILTYSSKSGHRFVYLRKSGRKPAQDLRDMINELGDLWWEKKHRTGKRYRASQYVLDTAVKKDIPGELLAPFEITRPHRIGKSLRYLKLSNEDLRSGNAHDTIKSAYRRQARKHHPDYGGTEKSFCELHDAYEELVSWLSTPKLRTRRGLPGKWCFDGRAWRTPLRTKSRDKSACVVMDREAAGFQDT